jgi:hypothetical protein
MSGKIWGTLVEIMEEIVQKFARNCKQITEFKDKTASFVLHTIPCHSKTPHMLQNKILLVASFAFSLL